ncbi:MAG TPA: thioredoxin domain-containing protein [Patescibacteria group bacterium]
MDPKLTKEEKKELKRQEKQDWQKQMDLEKRNSLFKKLAIWGGIVLFLAIGGWGVYTASTSPSSTSTSDIKIPKVTPSDFQTVKSGAKVTLVEYADFQCPACKAYYPVVKQLQSDFGTKLDVVYRFFPLENIHRNAATSAQAGYAASLQGKFWEMHDKLFDTQDSWAELPDGTDTFVGYAKDLGLNVDKFKSDMASSDTQKFVENSYQNALNLGLQGTPSFFLDGKFIDNPASYQAFKDLISKELK